jgi:hypothetical protein
MLYRVHLAMSGITTIFRLMAAMMVIQCKKVYVRFSTYIIYLSESQIVVACYWLSVFSRGLFDTTLSGRARQWLTIGYISLARERERERKWMNEWMNEWMNLYEKQIIMASVGKIK